VPVRHSCSKFLPVLHPCTLNSKQKANNSPADGIPATVQQRIRSSCFANANRTGPRGGRESRARPGSARGRGGLGGGGGERGPRVGRCRVVGTRYKVMKGEEHRQLAVISNPLGALRQLPECGN
jgi:hypothetical protein